MPNRLIARFFGFAVYLILGVPNLVGAQNIRLKFPKFEGRGWVWVLMRGEVQDTILSGVIPADGVVDLQLPVNRVGYQGMSRWLLRGGGGLDMVVNGENFQVTCLSDQPNEENIIYTGSPENDFLRQNYKEQEQLMNKYAAVQMLTRAYPPLHPLHQTALEEQLRLEADWVTFRIKLSASPLYAARFREIVDLTRGIWGRLNQSESERGQVVAEFLNNSLSWQALYTSNHWSEVIYNWSQLYCDFIKDDEKLIASARQILNSLHDAEIYTSFCRFMARYFVKLNKDSLLQVLGPEIMTSGRLLVQEGFASQFGAPQKGMLAPNLLLTQGLEEVDFSSSPARELSVGSLSKTYSILVYYLSGCGPCEETLKQLVASHPMLAAKGIRLISISAGTDWKVFQESAGKHPWADKYFDGQGFQGPNFMQYGVAGTPTIFLLDEKGIIQVRTANLLEILDWLDTKFFR